MKKIGKFNLSNKTLKILVSSLCCLTLGVIILVVILLLPDKKVIPYVPSKELNENSYVDTLIDVSNFIEIEIVSEVKVDSITSKISLEDQKNNIPSFTIKKSDDIFIVMPPVSGYNLGYIYKLELLDDNLFFKSFSFQHKRSITFSIYRDDIEKVKYNKKVIEVVTENVYEKPNNSDIIIMDLKTFNENNLKLSDIIVIPVENEQFISLGAYKIEKVDIVGNSVFNHSSCSSRR